MKLIERITLVLFSTLMLIISVIFCLLVFGWLDTNFIADVCARMIGDPISSNVILGLSVVFMLLALRGIFYDSSEKQKTEYKNGILLENADGQLLITRETIENLVNTIVKGFDSAEDVTTNIELEKDNTVTVYVHLTVRENAVIKELVSNLQTKIKDTIKKTSDLDVKAVNVKVRNVEPVKEEIIEG